MMSTSSGVSDSDDSGYEGYVAKSKMTHLSVHRNHHRPVKSFRISDILGHAEDRANRSNRNNGAVNEILGVKNFVRPWDDVPKKCVHRAGDSSDSDEEINVEDVDPVPPKPKLVHKSVSPLDALLQMTNKTFQGLDSLDGSDSRNKDQNSFLGKNKPPKKRRKSRTAFTNQQIYELEKRFLYQKYLTPADRDEIAQRLGLTNAQVITWFQNRRAKLKRELEELKNDVNAAKKTYHPSDAEENRKLELLESKGVSSPFSESEGSDKLDEEMEVTEKDDDHSCD